jgi:Ca-activated chloride channel family protein
MRASCSIGIFAWLWLSGAPSTASAQVSGLWLEYADVPRMLDCAPAGVAPCFRLKVNIVNGKGLPVPVQLPPPETLAQSIDVGLDGKDITPFYAAALNTDNSPTVRSRVALILVDISGSMNKTLPSGQTRFQAAQKAIAEFVRGFEDGVDRVAIVPFESHNVEATIRQAKFAATKNDALQQLNSISAPGPKNNTALYSAISIALDVLGHEAAQFSGTSAPEFLLITMTDGANEILRGDDAGLLQGPEGLKQVARKVQASHIPTLGIGFGEASQVDEASLSRLSAKHYMTADPEDLKQIFSFTRTLLNNRMTITLASPWPDRASLAGKPLRFTVSLKLASGAVVKSGVVTWSTPSIGVPLFEGQCDNNEMRTLLDKSVQGAQSEAGWVSVTRPVGIFLGISGLLIVLWFWVPRLVWPELFAGVPQITTKWQAPKPTPGRKPPAGFGTSTSRPGPSQRTPADATIVQSPQDLTKTRLDRNG